MVDPTKLLNALLAPLLRWTAQADGSYYVSVENWTGVSTGARTLTLTKTTEVPTDDHGNDLCSSTAITPDEEITGALHAPIDVDWFTFQAEAGTTHTITVSLSTLADSLLGLWDTKGETVLAVNDDYGQTLGSRIQWTAPESGTYFLDVENSDGVSVGSYTLNITSGV